MYGDYAAQPDIGFLTRREEILAGASVKVTQNWVVLGSVRYDLAVNQFDQTRFGVGYTDDCLLLSLNFITAYIYTGTTPTPNNTVMLQLSLRTLGPDCWRRSLRLSKFVRTKCNIGFCGELGGGRKGARAVRRRRNKSDDRKFRSASVGRLLCRGSSRGAIMLAAPPHAYAQQVVAFVNGQPITTLDIEHRAKFMQMSSKKLPPRKEVLDSLIDEILEIAEAKRYGIDVPDCAGGQVLQYRCEPAWESTRRS